MSLFAAGLLLAQQTNDSAAAAARKALDLMLAGQYAEMEAMFAPALQESLKLEALQKLGSQVKSWGAPDEIGTPSVRQAATTHIVVIPVKFNSQNVNVQMGVNAAGLLSGFIMLPGGLAWQHPSYSKPDSFQERAVTLGDDPFKLPGTLTVPKGGGPFPAVVLVHGNGPNDRDETAGAVKMFRDLAEGLASRGIVVLRYEKRTKVYFAKVTATAYTADDETVDDALSALEVLREQPEVKKDRIYVLGHGLGGYLAPRIAEQDGKVAGILALAANERPLEDVMVDQATGLNLPAADLAGVKTQAAKAKKLEAGDEDQPKVLGFPVAYWVDLKGYDPVATAKKLGIPVLVLHGDRDPGILAKDFEAWQSGLAGQKGCVEKRYASLNHDFVTG
ncbi:MAG TPA: alpha/beta fold hydrolase, partial [Candidatus Sulfopaludibacter sp.]|nr:alpha/beta fold hydrolase [Candidatus Sulfopaludibacter sp.]